MQQLLKKTSQNRAINRETVMLGTDYSPSINRNCMEPCRNTVRCFLHAIDCESSQYGPTPYRFLQRISIRILIYGKYAGVALMCLQKALAFMSRLEYLWNRRCESLVFY